MKTFGQRPWSARVALEAAASSIDKYRQQADAGVRPTFALHARKQKGR